MNTTWPANKLAWMLNSLADTWTRISIAARRFYGTASAGSMDATINRMPGTPAKGKMQTFKITNTETAPMNFLVVDTPPAKGIDVSHVGRLIHFWSPVVVDPETFGVVVTRRAGAQATNLVPTETARLLDVLVAAKEFMGQCDSEPKQFNLWFVSSDARDAKPRNVWLEMSMQDGTYRISLTDM